MINLSFATSVQFAGEGVGGINHPLVEDDPSLVTENIGLGFGNMLVIYHTCFLSSKMLQKLWGPN